MKQFVNYAGLLEQNAPIAVRVKSKSVVFTLGRFIGKDMYAMPVTNSLTI